MPKVQLTYKKSETVVKEIELTQEEYDDLGGHGNIFFEIEEKVRKEEPNYVDESITIDDYTY